MTAGISEPASVVIVPTLASLAGRLGVSARIAEPAASLSGPHAAIIAFVARTALTASLEVVLVGGEAAILVAFLSLIATRPIVVAIVVVPTTLTAIPAVAVVA